MNIDESSDLLINNLILFIGSSFLINPARGKNVDWTTLDNSFQYGLRLYCCYTRTRHKYFTTSTSMMTSHIIDVDVIDSTINLS